jgi:predicted Rossmann-fold nucleotide-binding protein
MYPCLLVYYLLQDELLAGWTPGDEKSFLTSSVDAAIYSRYRSGHIHDFVEHLAMRLHDTSIDEALSAVLEGHDRVVAFMGGHATSRDATAYLHVARAAARLTEEGYYVITGGGPGLMEAANLGAAVAGRPAGALEAAVDCLKAAALSFRDPGWLTSALAVRASLEATAPLRDTLGIPTWFYGHEPTNIFCKRVAKFFSNALREDTLVSIPRHGIIYAQGGPGTMQEVFQDACQNCYGIGGVVSPMIFLDKSFWLTERPAVPLLNSIARGKQAEQLIAVIDADDTDSVLAFLRDHPPVPFATGSQPQHVMHTARSTLDLTRLT